jgi:hypothetical protein
MYLGKDSCSATDDMTATHAAVRHLTYTVEGLGHKLFMDNFFSFLRLFDDSEKCKINLRGTVRPTRKDMPPDFGPKVLLKCYVFGLGRVEAVKIVPMDIEASTPL